MRYFIAIVAISAAGCSTPLFQTLVWNPNYCTTCYINGTSQPYVMRQPPPDTGQVEAAIRADQIRQDNAAWRQRWATVPVLPE